MTQPETGCDVLVVGAGLSGLTAGAYLSKAGLRVRLVEKEKQVGGLVNSFDYKGFGFDGGIRATENSGVLLPMLKQLGIEVELRPNPVSIGIGNDVVTVSKKDDIEEYRRLLERQFPDNVTDIKAIMAEIEKIMGYLDVLYGIDNPLFLDIKNDPKYLLRTILPWLLKYQLTVPKIAKLKQPVDEYLERFTSSRALNDIISQHFFRKTPAFFALSYFSIYLDYRYPKGGTGTLTRALERFIVEHGGEVLKETEIERLEPTEKRATNSAGNVHRYQRLVWSADMFALYRAFDSSVLDARTRSAVEKQKAAMAGKVGGDSVFTVYLTVDRDPAEFGKISAGHFFYTPSKTGLSKAALSELAEGDGFVTDRDTLAGWLKRHLALNTYEISIPVLRDPDLAPPGRTGLIVSLLFDYRLTKHIEATGWYDEFRRLMSDGIIEVLDSSIYPGLKDAVLDSFTATPLTIQRISGSTDGAITGWAFTNDDIPAESRMPRIARSVLTPMPGIYQAGQWTYIPSGLPVSILTGKLAADRVVKDLA